MDGNKQVKTSVCNVLKPYQNTMYSLETAMKELGSLSRKSISNKWVHHYFPQERNKFITKHSLNRISQDMCQLRGLAIQFRIFCKLVDVNLLPDLTERGTIALWEPSLNILAQANLPLLSETAQRNNSGFFLLSTQPNKWTADDHQQIISQVFTSSAFWTSARTTLHGWMNLKHCEEA